jgi:antitoxin FitA
MKPLPEAAQRPATSGPVAPRSECLHYVSMPNVLIRDVPQDVHARLQARADGHGQSLQQYLAGELRRLAERPSMDEVLARIATRRGGRVGLEQAGRDLAADRDRR